MYQAVTRGIRITVEPQFVEDQSTPDEGYFFWSYTVDIANESQDAVQLTSRYWQITDSDGRSEEVRGPGVVGQTPSIPPGESFTYTSGCPLATPSGIMSGSYKMATEEGDVFDAVVPAFSLDCDYAVRTVN